MFANVPNKVCKKPYCFELLHFMKTLNIYEIPFLIEIDHKNGKYC